jgi:F0F1-type ATP synthase membrane subunit b/b'
MSSFSDFVLSRITLRNIKKSDRIASNCDKRYKKISRRLEKRKKLLQKLQRRIDSVAKVVTEDVEESEKTVEKMKTALDAVRDELQIAEEVTIPGLVKCNKLLLERTSADTAEQVRRQVNNIVPRNEE